MSWIPKFELGFWNAWIPGLFILLHPLVMNLVDRFVGTGNMNQKMGDVPAEPGKKNPIPISTLLLVVLFIYSIFLPLQLATIWFYIGLAVYLIGFAMFLSAIITAAKTPAGQVFSRGIYRYSRHPMYLAFLLIFLGISLSSLSWLFLVLSMGWMVFPISQVAAEERECAKSLGAEYQAYVDRTPKWLGIPKSN